MLYHLVWQGCDQLELDPGLLETVPNINPFARPKGSHVRGEGGSRGWGTWGSEKQLLTTWYGGISILMTDMVVISNLSHRGVCFPRGCSLPRPGGLAEHTLSHTPELAPKAQDGW